MVKNYKKLRYGGLSIALTALLIAIVVLLNVVISSLAAKHLWFIDMTSNDIYTLSDECEKLMTKVSDALGSNSQVRSIFANSDLQFGKIRDENGKLVKMEVKVGDKVITAKYTGTEVKCDGVEYSIVRQSDVLAIVED